MSQPERERRRIVVTGTKVVASGIGQHGEWKLREVQATTLDGRPIKVKLVSFDELAGEVEVDVERQDPHPVHGVSYRVRPVRQKPHERIDALEQRVARLERALAAQERQP